ncbi:MAG: translation initiation factor IF-2 subunit alpha [Thermoplasmataceae archaeon]
MTKNLPDAGDVVVVTIKNVKKFGADVSLDEYPGTVGFIHIAEVATGWVKYIKDYLREGQKTVCKVLSVDPTRGNVELSLKRVNDHQKRAKISEWKDEQKAKKLMELLSKQLKKTYEECMTEFGNNLEEEYGSIYAAFEDASSGEDFMPEVKAKWKTAFVKISKENVTPPFVKIGGYIEAYSLQPNGVELIKDTFEEIKDEEGVTVQYAGAPRYRIMLREKEYKIAEEKLKKLVQKLTDKGKKENVVVEFSRSN